MMPIPCYESDGYAHPDDHVDRLGRLFVALRLHEKYGITFERWLEMIENGSWELTFGESRLKGGDHRCVSKPGHGKH